MINLSALIQTSVDTASVMQKYADKWDADVQADQAGVIMQTLASNDLIFIVLCVTLIIWFVLLFFIIRTDRKVSKLQESLTNQQNKQEDET